MSYHPLGIYDHSLGGKKGLLKKMLPNGNINIELPFKATKDL
jgi:hypothetical protein